MKAKWIVTDLKKGSFWEEREAPEGGLDAIHQISVYPTFQGQRFLGFGGAFTEASAHNYQKLSPEKRKSFLEHYFGKTGLGYTLGRVHIGSCDFALGTYSCREQEEAAFDVSRDETYLIPMIREAEAAAGQKIGLLLSPWSPPAFMKSNADRCHGGKLLPEYAARWAEYMAEYAAYYREAGLQVERITVQNEPAAVQTWDSCIYSAEEEGAFAADHLRSALDRAGCADVRILAWDHNKEILPYRAEKTLSVPGAREAVSGFAVHWYTGDHFDALTALKKRFPDQELWFTEGCVEYSRFEGADAVRKAEMYAHDILGNLKGGIQGSLDWNLLLDSKGGPNHVGNFCEAPIMLTGDEKDFSLRSEYYYIGHFSRYIRPDAVNLGCSVYGGVEAVAFRNADESLAVVVLNTTELPRFLTLTTDGAVGYPITLEPHTIATFLCQP